jgi:hypothetical protein
VYVFCALVVGSISASTLDAAGAVLTMTDVTKHT